MVTRWNELKHYVDVDQVLEELGLSTSGGVEAVQLCPLHDNRSTPSFSVNREKKVYNCLGCGESGNLADLVAKVKKIDYKEALDWLRVLAGNPYDDPEAFVAECERILFFTPEVKDKKNHLPRFNPKVLEPWLRYASMHPEYYESRGIDLNTVLRLPLGIDPTHSRRYREKDTGIWKEWVGPAAIIPVWYEGVLVGWQERWLGDTPEGLPKYTNTDDFPRRYCLYNYDYALGANPVTVVESPMTVAYLTSNDIVAVATFGAEANPEQVQLLRRFPKIYLGYDNDKAGLDAARKMINALQYTNELYVLPVIPGEKSDLNDVPAAELAGYYERAVPALLYEGVN